MRGGTQVYSVTQQEKYNMRTQVSEQYGKCSGHSRWCEFRCTNDCGGGNVSVLGWCFRRGLFEKFEKVADNARGAINRNKYAPPKPTRT